MFLTLFSFAAQASTSAAPSKKSVLDKTFNWDGSEVRLQLELPSDWNDPGDYTDLTLSRKGLKTFPIGNPHAQAYKMFY
jgi:hypothetical protein